jgi:hypothetical protein
MKPLEFLVLYSNMLYKIPEGYEGLLSPEKQIASLGFDKAQFEKFQKPIQETILELVQIKADLNLQIQEFSSGSHSEEISKNFGDVFGSNSFFNLGLISEDITVFKNEDGEEGVSLGLIIFLGAVAVFVAKLGFYAYHPSLLTII